MDLMDLQREVEKKQAELELREGLPFLFGWPWYQWAWDFFQSKNKVNFLCAANQVSKSSTQIRKCIDWATNKEKWPDLWIRSPKQFWYMYPSQKVADAEWLTKWSLFMPKGKYKDDPVYGWKEIKEKGHIVAIAFNSGVYVFFKVYSQSVDDLQSGTLDALFCFEGHMPVLTEHGIRRIDSIRVGDRVVAASGELRRVDKNFARSAPTIRRLLSNGEFIDATPDHKIWVGDRGWVELGELTPLESLGSGKEWSQEKRRLGVGLGTIATRVTPINVDVIFGRTAIIPGRSSFIRRCGESIGVGYLRDSLSTTWTRIQGTIRFLIWPVYRRLSTPATISGKSGPTGCLASPNARFASNAVKFLGLGLPKKQPLWCALKAAGEFLREQKSCASLAIRHLFGLPTTRSDVFVLSGAVGRGEKEVYCLNVNTEHNFQVCGIIGKNCDEEMPDHLYSELNARLTASDGYFHMVFTATLGQEFWRQTLEPRADEAERFPTAAKWCVSLYDSQFYIDGTRSHWTDEKIANVKARCKSHAEFLKRVMGRFVVVGGRKYESFDATKHVKPKHPIPPGWLVFEGVDIGGGGESHKSAICFIGVRPDFRAGRAFLGWRGDDGITTSGDVFKKHLEMKKEHKVKPIRQFYDWGNKDFGTIATRAGEPFEKAEKGHDIGEDVINTLFKNDMLFIYEDPELAKLAGELATLLKSTAKNKAKDDFADAFRYAVTKVPWDFSYLTGAKSDMAEESPEEPMNSKERELHERRNRFEGGTGGELDPSWDIEAEFEDWNSAYGS